ncbi:MAG TPA: hypothetical protein VI365_22500 [Trebonia sp.]
MLGCAAAGVVVASPAGASTHVGRGFGAPACTGQSVLRITGTPVIDPARQEIYVVADVLVNGKAAHMLTGLNTATGQVELSQDVDPPDQAPPNLLQRTGLTLDDGHVYFGFGGNTEMCGTYHGRVVSAPEAGGTPSFFTTTLEPGDGRGSVWMGGGGPPSVSTRPPARYGSRRPSALPRTISRRPASGPD